MINYWFLYQSRKIACLFKSWGKWQFIFTLIKNCLYFDLNISCFLVRTGINVVFLAIGRKMSNCEVAICKFWLITAGFDVSMWVKDINWKGSVKTCELFQKTIDLLLIIVKYAIICGKGKHPHEKLPHKRSLFKLQLR